MSSEAGVVRSATSCPQCSEKFPTKGLLRKHLATHKEAAAAATAAPPPRPIGRSLRSAKASPVPDAPSASSKRAQRAAKRASPLVKAEEEEDEEIPDDPTQPSPPSAQSSPASPQRRASFHCKERDCDAVFAKGPEARSHWDREHSPDKAAAAASPERPPGVEYASDSCKICGKNFCGSFNVRRHIIRVHGIVLPKLKPGRKKGVKLKRKKSEEGEEMLSLPGPVEPKDGLLACPAPVCSRTFEREEDLRRHFKLFHARKLAPPLPPRPPPKAPAEKAEAEKKKTAASEAAAPNGGGVTCDACGKSFRDGFNLRRHEVAVHIKGGTPHRSRKRNGEEVPTKTASPAPASKASSINAAPKPMKMYSSRDSDGEEDEYAAAIAAAAAADKAVECEICEEAFPTSRELRRHELNCLQKWSKEAMDLPGEETRPREKATGAGEAEMAWTESGRPRRAALERRASTDWTAIPHFCMLCGQVFPSDGKVATHLREAHKDVGTGIASPDSRVAALLANFTPTPPAPTTDFKPSSSSAFRVVKPTPPPGDCKLEQEEEAAKAEEKEEEKEQEEEEKEEEEEEEEEEEPARKKSRRGRAGFVCGLCQKACRDRYAFRKHMAAHETGTARGPNNATLIRAGLDPTEVRARLKEAKETGLPILSLGDEHGHACPACEETFPNRQELLIHKAFCE